MLNCEILLTIPLEGIPKSGIVFFFSRLLYDLEKNSEVERRKNYELDAQVINNPECKTSLITHLPAELQNGYNPCQSKVRPEI